MKSILLITYYFPPCGGAAVQRWLRLLPLLQKAGYKVTVLTTANGDYLMRDESLLAKIPAEIEIVRTFTPGFSRFWQSFAGKEKSLPYGSLDTAGTSSRMVKLMFWLRLNVVYPDVRVMWNIFAKAKALYLCRVQCFDWVITTGPPHSTHLIGLYLKKHIKTKWLADFRDPWTQIYYLTNNNQNRLIQKLNRNLEKQVVQTADLNLVISNYIAEQLPQGRKYILYNGFDEEQFDQNQYAKGETFRIKFIGQLTEGQNIHPLLHFISEKTQANGYHDIAFTFVGTHISPVSDVSFPVEYLSYLPHQQAINEMIDCELLILLINDYSGNQGMLTTKLFEYTASRTPILCIGPLDGEAAQIITQSEAGFAAESISEQIWDYVDDLYKKWQASETVRSDHDISQWSAQQQVKELISVLP